MESRPAFVRLVHATARIGAVLVLLNVQLTRSELQAHVSLVDPDRFVCETDTETVAEELADGRTILSVDRPESWPTTDDGRRSPTPHDWSPDDNRVLLFTSGTTGRPKAVPLTDGNLRSSATASAFRLGVLPDDRWLDPLSPYHMGGLAPIVRSAIYGTTVVLQREFDPDKTIRNATRYEITGTSVVPTMLRRLLDADDPLPDSLRFVLTGGAPTPPALVERCGREGVPICPTYGMTETASQVATATPEGAQQAPESVGQPLSVTRVTIVGEDGDPLPTGEMGEVVVDGPTVTPGYLQEGAAVGDESGSGESPFGAYGFRTGDVGYRDDSGRLSVLNRRTDRILTGGKNVHPGEVIAALRELPEVRDAAVLGLPDPEWGERVGALIVPALGERTGEGCDPDRFRDPNRFRDALDGTLARYKHPRTVGIVDSLPRTLSGTVDREAAREKLLDVGVDIS